MGQSLVARCVTAAPNGTLQHSQTLQPELTARAYRRPSGIHHPVVSHHDYDKLLARGKNASFLAG